MRVACLLSMCLILGMLDQGVCFANLPNKRLDFLTDSFPRDIREVVFGASFVAGLDYCDSAVNATRPVYTNCRSCPDGIPTCANPKRKCNSKGPCLDKGQFCKCEKTNRLWSPEQQACVAEHDCHVSSTPYFFCSSTLPNLVDLRPTKEWCGSDAARQADKDVCEAYFRTGTNGHVYPCEYKDGACLLSSKSTLCCGHLCDNLESRTEMNAGSGPGEGPWCASKSTSQNDCEAAYWTGKDLKKYPCVWDKEAASCRLSLSDACICP